MTVWKMRFAITLLVHMNACVMLDLKWSAQAALKLMNVRLNLASMMELVMMPY
jgi:hypothetical protein